MASPPAPAKSSIDFIACFPVIAIKKCSYDPSDIFQILHLTLPNDQNVPAQLLESLTITLVPQCICLKLRFPEIKSGFGQSCKRTVVVPVPEAPVHEDHLTPTWKNQVWLARQLTMKAIAIPQAMHKTAKLHFWLGVLALNPGHSFTTFLLGKRIDHPNPSYILHEYTVYVYI